jgi:NhaP-type Na+/H+ or K+/H+ antiporter
MQGAELILALLAVAAAMEVLAYRAAIPHPVVLVLGGDVLAFIPDFPRLTLAPETLFVLFVPALLYRAAATSSLRDFRAQLRPIAFLSIVMVLATMCAIAAVAHAYLFWKASCSLSLASNCPTS